MKYLSFSKLGHYGRIGNCLWEIAATISLAKRHNRIPAIPTSFEWRDKLNIPDEYYKDVTPTKTVQEYQYHYIPNLLEGADDEPVVDLVGTFQSILYWSDIQDEIYTYLRPKDAGDFGKYSVGVHIRKGDYQNNSSYCAYDIDYYKSAMKKYFSDPRYQFYIVSDDYNYIESHFEHSEKYIMAYRTPYEDFCNLASCQNHILSGSSFSFWGAFLSPTRGKIKTYRVPRTHTGHLAHLDESTSYMPDWMIHNDKHNVVLCCYADNKYKHFQDRLIGLNKKEQQFDDVHAYTREWLETTDFYKTNKNLLDEKMGGGYWAWKPYVILESLSKMEEGDILLYMDSGDIFFSGIREFLVRELADKYMLLTEGGNIQKDWTKRDCFIAMDCDGPEYWDAQQIEAGVIAMRNCSKTRKIVKEWMEWCCKPHVINDEPSKVPNFETFVSHCHDQSLLQNIRILHDIPMSPAIREYTVCNVDDKAKEKIPLKNATFIIPCKMDSSDRNENMVACINWIQSNFDTNVIVGEQGTHEFEYVKDMGCKYMWFDMEFFHRTRMLNLMTVEADTDIIFGHDCDVFLCIEAVVKAVKLLETGTPFVLPYSGAFLHAPRKFYKIINSIGYIEPFINLPFKGRTDNSVGGSFCFRRDLWILENENFKGHSPEDRFRAAFARILYDGLVRLDYPLIHLDHFIGPDSSHATNSWAVFNNSETRKCKSLKTKEQVLEYVNSWPFYHEHKAAITAKTKK
jgi:hypothetical protein